MNRPEIAHRYNRYPFQVGEGIFNKLVSNAGKKFMTKAIDSIVQHGAEKAGEFIVNQATKRAAKIVTKRPGELIQEYLAEKQDASLDEEEKYLQDALDRILKI